MKLWVIQRPGERARMISVWLRLKAFTCSEEKRWKSSRAAGLVSVTARWGGSTWSKLETSIDQNVAPQASFSRSGD